MKMLSKLTPVLLLGSLLALWSCTKEHARTDISLEMTDQDPVEAIVDQDLLTAGGTVVNIEDEPGSSHGRSNAVAYVDQIDVQKPVLVESDRTLKPGATGATASTETEISGIEEPVMVAPTGTTALAESTHTRLGPVGETEQERLQREAGTPAQPPGGELIVKPSGRNAIPAVERASGMPLTYPSHVVQRGDTLWSIGNKYGCTISELVAANGLSRRSVLQIGQTLVVPVAKTGQPPATTPPAEGSATPAPGPAGITPEPGAATGAVASAEAGGGATAPPVNGTTTAAPAVETEQYAIQQGDSYWKIARKFGTTVDELMKLNDTTSDKLKIGQKILVPKK